MSPPPSSSAVESTIIVHNIAKRHNVGTLARSATAFGVSEVVLVGRRDFNSFGSHGSTSHLRFRHFSSLSLAHSYLKERDFDICGVEITEGAAVVTEHPFRKSTAFLVGNEGTGLSPKECEICDFFVYIPQYGCGTASLNVTVAASIVLHHFGDSADDVGLDVSIRLVEMNVVYHQASDVQSEDNLHMIRGYPLDNQSRLFKNVALNISEDLEMTFLSDFNYAHHSDSLVWAGFPERSREGNKFTVAERPVKQVKRNYCAESIESVIEERKNKRESADNDVFEEPRAPDGSQASNVLGALFEC